jgi:hypothetical protein
MPKITVDHILGFLDGRIVQWQAYYEESCDSRQAAERAGRLRAYEDLKAYILIEGLDPE